MQLLESSDEQGSTNREGIQMTLTRLILLVMAVFIVVFAFRVFGSGLMKK